MTNLMSINSDVTITSKEISELTGKLHSNIMVDCRKLDDAYENLGQLKIQLGSYKDIQNQQRPMFTLTKMQTMDLMTGYSIELRIKVNRRWEELENAKQFNLPKTYSEALRQLADQTELSHKTLELLDNANDTIKTNKPKVVFADSVKGSNNSILVRKFAKDLCDGGFEIGQNRIFRWFRENKYLNNDNEPYQNYVAQGLFEVITRVVGSSYDTFTTKTTKLTGKGQLYFTKKIKEEYE